MSNLTKAINALNEQPATVPFVYPPQQNNSTSLTPRERIAELIKQERKAKGWTQRELASQSNYSQGTVARIEKYGNVSYSALLSFVEVLGKEITLTDKQPTT